MDVSNAPKSKGTVLTLDELKVRLGALVGSPIKLTRKARTDGANVRKMVTELLQDRVANALEDTEYEILPPKGKGVPRLLLEMLDTYVVTSGDVYNLQIWNRMPNSNAPLVRYKDGEVITCQDIRLVLVKVDMEKDEIESVVILTPQYIEEKFGKFGKPTIKQQLLVSNTKRKEIVDSPTHIYSTADTENIAPHLAGRFSAPKCSSNDAPVSGRLLPIKTICSRVAENLIGKKLAAADTKTRGQLLEKEVISMLGYGEDSKLVGGYPDVPNQLLEVKVQDTQTIDLGRFSPQFVEVINDEMNLTTQDVRYLIALTNAESGCIEGVIVSSGEGLGEIFTYVSDKSYKCQRSIPMEFFKIYIGQCVANP